MQTAMCKLQYANCNILLEYANCNISLRFNSTFGFRFIFFLVTAPRTPVLSPNFSLGLGVDFVLPLSQEQQEEPHQNLPEGSILEVLDLAKSLTKPNQTHATPLLT